LIFCIRLKKKSNTKSDIDLYLQLTQVNATHLSALKSLCKCEHLKALFIAFYKKSTIFCLRHLFEIIHHLSLLTGW